MKNNSIKHDKIFEKYVKHSFSHFHLKLFIIEIKLRLKDKFENFEWVLEEDLKKKPSSVLMKKNSDGGFLKGLFVLTLIVSFISLFVYSDVQTENVSDHEKAIKAVNEGEILPLNEILKKLMKIFMEGSYLLT